MTYDCIIIGAGIAGLAAGNMLQAEGKRVLILEAESEMGGRIKTIDWQGERIDLGASYCHGLGVNSIHDLLKREGATLHRHQFRQVRIHPVQDTAPFEDFLTYLERAYIRKSDSLAKHLTLFAAKEMLNPMQKTALHREIFSYVETEYGCNANEISARYIWEEEGDYKGGDWFVKGGYDKLTNALAKGLDIRLNTAVKQVNHVENGIEVITANEIFHAKKIICAVSLGVLKRGDITFNPALPKKKQAAIDALSMGNLTKTLLLFPNKFWGEEELFGIVGSESGLFQEFIDLSAIYDKPLLLAFHGGMNAVKITEMTKQQREQQALQQLRRAFPSSPPPSDSLHVSWVNSIAGGSFSIVPAGASFKEYEILSLKCGALHFAGEHTNAKHPYTVSGAYRSGLRAAKEVLRKGWFY